MQKVEKNLRRKLKARLYLNAVLPAFEDLLQHDARAREIVVERNFNLRFQTSSGLKSTLIIENQSCRFQKLGSARSNIILHFMTEDHLNREFEQAGFRLPLPIKGASRVNDLKAFKALSKQLEKALRPEEADLQDPAFHEFHVGLQLGIALRAVGELARHEPLSRNIMRETPRGIAYFSVGADGYGAWLRWEGNTLTAGKNDPPRTPDVTVEFKDAATALKAVGNKIDVMAALGLGDIKITGLTPLADSLGYIFERIPLYISP